MSRVEKEMKSKSKIIRVLLVEDNPGDARLIKEVLGEKRYRIITAETGEDGLKKAKTEKPDLIIIDTLLPGIHGFEVCRRIRKNQGRTTPKIIITIGVIDAIDAVKARRMGADGYCVKTTDCSPLLHAIKKIS